MTKYHEFLTKGQSANFTNQEEFDNLTNDIFYNEVNEVIQAISIGSDYATTLENFGKLEAGPLFIKMSLVEYFYFGQCAVISLESIRAQMVKDGDLKPTEKDSNFVLAVFLTVSFYF